jgi:hypothetical protein
MCSCDDAEPAIFHVRVERTARVEHRCYECNERILPGSRYVSLTAKWDRCGSIHRDAFCLHCEELREAWHDFEGCWLPYGNLLDELRQCLDYDGREAWFGLLHALRARRRGARKEAA